MSDTTAATPSTVARRAAFLRAVARKPRPGEPTGLGAVVQAGNGDLYTVPKVTATSKRWANAYGMNDHTRYGWDQLPLPVTVLSHGVKVVVATTSACICDADGLCLGVPGESDACAACLVLDQDEPCLHDPEIETEDEA